jgi:hypothetical protein
MSEPDSSGSHEDWQSSGLEARVLSGYSRSTLAMRGDAALFSLARSQRLLEKNAAEYARPRSSLGCTSPLKLLDRALTRAVEKQLVPEMAEFMLSRARWQWRLASQGPLDAVRVGAQDRAFALADTGDDQRTNLWYLLLAWEYADTDNPGEARATLRKLLLERPRPRIERIRISDWAATLLRHTVDVDRAMFLELQAMLDDNSRLELGRELVKAGELDLATAVAQAMQVFLSYRAKLLVAVAKAQAGAGDTAGAGRTAALALLAVNEIRDDDDWLAEYLAEVGSVQALGDDVEGAEVTFARATKRALASDRRVDGLAAVAVGQAQAGLLDAAAATIRLLEHTDPRNMSNEDDHGEALEAYAVACLPDDIEAAVAALRRMSPTYTYRNRAVGAVCERLVRSGWPDRAMSLVRDLPEGYADDRVRAAAVRVLAETGSWSRALALVDDVGDPGWRAEALLDLVRLAPPSAAEAFGDALSDGRIRATITAITSDEDRAGMLARYAVTRPADVRTRLLDQALGIASGLDPDSRWRTFAEIATIQADHGFDGASVTFAAARAVLEETERDSDWDGHNLWRLGAIQAEHGDPCGARETFAVVLRGPTQDGVLRLAAMSLIGVALAQARAGSKEAARQISAAAMRATRGLNGEEQASLEPVVMRMLVEADDIAAAVSVVYAVLDRLDGNEDPLSAAMAAAFAAGPVALRLVADGDEGLARDLLSDVSGRVRPLLAGSLAPAESLVELAKAQVEVGDIEGALATVAGSDYNLVVGPIMAAVAAVRARLGKFEAAEKTATEIAYARWQVEARCAVATEMSAQGNRDAAAQLLWQARAEIRASAENMAPLLVKVAETQAALDQLSAARETLMAARAVATDIDTTWTRATIECRIAQTQAKIGDFDNARLTAESIEEPHSAGEAMLWAAVYQVGAASGDAALRVASEGVQRIASPFWRAVGLVLLAAVKQKRGDADAPSIHAQAYGLIATVPVGEAHAKLREVLAEAALAVNDWALATRWVRQVTVDRPQRLLELANALAEHGATEAVTHLVPDCAHQLDSAYMVLPTLSRVFPEHALAIAALVAATVGAAMHDEDEPEPALPRVHRDRWLARSFDGGPRPDGELDDDSESVDDGTESPPGSEDPLADVALSEAVQRALRQAVADLGPGEPLDTRTLLRRLIEAHGVGDWSRISLHFAGMTTLASADAVDPAPQQRGRYDQTPLTGSCTRALRTAVRLAVEYDMWPMAPGILALGLVADPESAAARGLGVVDEATHVRLVALVLEDLLNTNLNDLDLSTDNNPEDDFPPGWADSLSAGGECDRQDHVLRPAPPEPDRRLGGMVFTVSCSRCGVGCAVRFRKIGPTTMKTKLTVFPARGSYAISRQFIRQAFFSWEGQNQEEELAGFTVIRETPLIKGSPHGI